MKPATRRGSGTGETPQSSPPLGDYLTRGKRLALANPLIGGLNALVKGQSLVSRHQAEIAHYRDLQPRLPDRARQRSRDLRLERINHEVRSRRLRVLFIGTDEQQDRGGLLQALSELAELEIYESEPGIYGHVPPAGKRFDSQRDSNGRRLVEIIDDATHRSAPPDVVIGQMWGATMSVDALHRARKHGCITINICMDDRQAFLRSSPIGTHALIPGIDHFATTAPEVVDWYRREGVDASFVPEASDPAIFKRSRLPKLHDVTFVGARYGVRAELVAALERSGVKVTTFGSGWPSGRLDIDAVPELFSRSRIVLGVGYIGHSRSLCALKLRDFDGPMSGSLYITSHNPDLSLVYDTSREILTYRSIEDCVQLCRKYVEPSSDREEIARQGRTRALRDHTWRRRLSDLFRNVGLALP